MAENASAAKPIKRKAQPKAEKAGAPKPAALATTPMPSQNAEPGASKPAVQPPPSSPMPAPPLIPPPPPPAAAPKEPQPEKQDDFFDYISEPFGAWWSFIAADFKEYYVRMLKLNFARLFAMVGLAVLIVISLFVLYYAAASAGSTLAAIAVALLLLLAWLLVAAWLDQCFESAAFALTEAQISKKQFGMLAALNWVKGSTFKFVLVDAVVRFVFFLPAIVVLAIPMTALFSGSPLAGTIFLMGFWVAYLFFLVYGFFANLLLAFLTQFWRYGFLFGGMGVIASLKGGVSLIKRRFPEVVAFDLIIIALTLAASIPYFMFFGITWLGLLFLQMMAMAIPLVGLAIYLIAAFIVALIAVFLTTIADLAWRPAQYLVWRKVSEK